MFIKTCLLLALVNTLFVYANNPKNLECYNCDDCAEGYESKKLSNCQACTGEITADKKINRKCIITATDADIAQKWKNTIEGPNNIILCNYALCNSARSLTGSLAALAGASLVALVYLRDQL